MAQVCKGVCEHIHAMTYTGKMHYQRGHKWCACCARFFLVKNIVCPCCKTRLRTKPRSRKRDLPRM